MAVPWRKNDDDAKMDEERPKGDDGRGLQGDAGDGGTCSGAEESVRNT